MSAFTDFLFNAFSGALETVGESKLIEILQQLHDSNPDDYKAAIFGGHALTKHLVPIVTKSSTKIDDAILGAIQEAVKQSAANNGVVLE